MPLKSFSKMDLLRVAKETSARMGLNLLGDEGIDNFRNVEFAKEHLWALTVMGDGKPDKKPFDKFFPCSDVSIDFYGIDDFNVSFGQDHFVLPESVKSTRKLTLTLYDDKDFTLHKWLEDWIFIDILNSGQYVSCLNDAHIKVGERRTTVEKNDYVSPVRQFYFVRLDNFLNPIEGTEQVLYVYPSGDFKNKGSSRGNAITFDMEFVIVGDATKNKAKDESATTAAKLQREATRMLGRFL